MPQGRTNRIDKKTFAQYLIAEMEGLHSRAIHYDQTLAGKINLARFRKAKKHLYNLFSGLRQIFIYLWQLSAFYAEMCHR